MGMFIVKKGGKRPVSSGNSQAVNARGNAMEKKVERREKNLNKERVVGEMSRWLETDHIQPQQTVPVFTEGR